jgi:hypothetical protein
MKTTQKQRPEWKYIIIHILLIPLLFITLKGFAYIATTWVNEENGLTVNDWQNEAYWHPDYTFRVFLDRVIVPVTIIWGILGLLIYLLPVCNYLLKKRITEYFTNCGAENPNGVKFRKRYGYPIPAVSELKWIETLTVKIRCSGGRMFLDVLWIMATLIYILFSVFVLALMTGGERYGLTNTIDTIVCIVSVWISTLTVFVITYRRLSYGKRKTSQLRRIASDIEDSGRSDKYMAKSGKYGLYDWEKKKVLLPVEYDAFEPVNNGTYYIVVKQNKRGLYSRLLNAVIVPCEYDAITPFVNNIATISKGDVTKQIDTQGNIF